jgi:uncharacterized repeat protein (TIGR03837 family)
MRQALRWDIFCRVVDNLGDAAVCWRLARQLADEHDLVVRLWIDLPDALARLVPGAAPGNTHEGVSIAHWHESDPRLGVSADVADVVIAAFACTLPDGYRLEMRTRRPVWVDLEYLSAQAWVDSHHGLPSPKPDGLIEHFFFPGPGSGAGGMLREHDLIARRDAFDADPAARNRFLEGLGVEAGPGDRFVSLFCYPWARVGALLAALDAAPGPGQWRVLVAEGVACDTPEHPRLKRVPFVPQRDIDRLLWCCELNFVRGEDSFVRALWAGRPMVWQIYPQQDGAHLPKLQAFVARWLETAGLPDDAARAFEHTQVAWNIRPGTEHPAEDVTELSCVKGAEGTEDPIDPAVAALAALLRTLPVQHAGARRVAAAHSHAPGLAARLVEFVACRL